MRNYSSMGSLFKFKNKQFAVVFTDNSVQVADGYIMIKEQLPEYKISRREICDFNSIEKIIKRLFRKFIPRFTRFFTNVEIYVTRNPLAAEVEMRALRDVFRILTSKQHIKTIPFPVATFIGLKLTPKQTIIVDVDKKDCYISLLENCIFKDFIETDISSNSISNAIKKIIKNDNDEKTKEIWFVGTNEKISDISNSIAQLSNLRVHIADNRKTATIEGLRMIMDNPDILLDFCTDSKFAIIDLKSDKRI